MVIFLFPTTRQSAKLSIQIFWFLFGFFWYFVLQSLAGLMSMPFGRCWQQFLMPEKSHFVPDDFNISFVQLVAVLVHSGISLDFYFCFVCFVILAFILFYFIFLLLLVDTLYKFHVLLNWNSINHFWPFHSIELMMLCGFLLKGPWYDFACLFLHAFCYWVQWQRQRQQQHIISFAFYCYRCELIFIWIY